MHRLVVLALTLAAPSTAQSSCKGGIPSSEVNAFLSAHNSLRASISSGSYVAKGGRMPAAKTPIPALTWNCTIAEKAQSYANRCIFQHSTDRNGLGENLYTYWSSATVTTSGMGKKASDSWSSEFLQYGWPGVKLTSAAFNTGIGHATQMAWAKTTSMGCGLALCQSNKQVMVVCQYNPAGNYLNQNVYEPK